VQLCQLSGDADPAEAAPAEAADEDDPLVQPAIAKATATAAAATAGRTRFMTPSCPMRQGRR